MCSAGSRLLVQEPVFDKFIEKLKVRMKNLRLGSSLDKAFDMGAIIDPSQQKFIAEYVDGARKEGAEVRSRSHRLSAVFNKVRYISMFVPLLLIDCKM